METGINTNYPSSRFGFICLGRGMNIELWEEDYMLDSPQEGDHAEQGLPAVIKEMATLVNIILFSAFHRPQLHYEFHQILHCEAIKTIFHFRIYWLGLCFYMALGLQIY